MSKTLQETKRGPSILVERIVEDILSRNLSPGDPYLTAAEAGSQFGVSRATADRALQVLTERNILSRQRGQGTFIGPAAMPLNSTPTQKSSAFPEQIVLISPHESSHSQYIFQMLVSRMPTSIIKAISLPDDLPLAYTRHQIELIKNEPARSVAVAMSAGSKIYQLLAEERIPTLILGSTNYTSPMMIPLDRDAKQAGFELLRFLGGRGHKRFVLFLSSSGLTGTHRFLDGISGMLSHAGLPASALTQRFVPNDPEELKILVRDVLRGRDRPTGVICNKLATAIHALEVAESLRLNIPRDLEIVFSDSLFVEVPDGRFPYARPVLSPMEAFQRAMELIGVLRDQRNANPTEELIPIRMEIPSGYPPRKLQSPGQAGPA